MGEVVRFRERHARTSLREGHKSGRRSDLETPVSRSMVNTNSAGTPFLDRESQYQTWDCVVPIRSASGFWPPTTSHARLSASIDDMEASYPIFGSMQPKNLSEHTYLNFGNARGMSESIDPIKFGLRVRELREELEWSQTRLGKSAGFSQSNIGWIEQGRGKNPKKQAIALADALGSTPQWLLYGTGERRTGILLLTKEQLSSIYDDLPVAVREIITNAVKAGSQPKKRAAR